MCFITYSHVTLEMKGRKGGEGFALMMKDKYDLRCGAELRVEIKLIDIWENYKVPLAEFKTADKMIIQTPIDFVFLGDQGMTIHVRSIQFN